MMDQSIYKLGNDDMSMGRGNVFGLVLFAYLASMNVFAQTAPGSPPSPLTSSPPASVEDSLNIVDDGGSLRIAPAGSTQTSLPKSKPQSAPRNVPGHLGPDSTNLRPDGSVRPNIESPLGGPPSGNSPPSGRPVSDDAPSTGMPSSNDSPPPDELQTPSAPNQGMVPESPSQESVPVPDQGSMQN